MEILQWSYGKHGEARCRLQAPTDLPVLTGKSRRLIYSAIRLVLKDVT